MCLQQSRGPEGFKGRRFCSCPEEFVVAINPWLRDEPRFHGTFPLFKSLPIARLLFWDLLVPLMQLWPPRLSPSFLAGVVPRVSTDEGLAPPWAAWALLRHPTPQSACLVTATRKSQSASPWVGQRDAPLKPLCKGPSPLTVKSRPTRLSTQANAHGEKDEAPP